jgi:hypothetical protein
MNPAEAVSTRLPFARSVDTGSVVGAATRARLIAPALAIALAALALRMVLAPHFDGLDDAGYLEAALRVSNGQTLDHLFPLFRTRVGMAYPFGALLSAGWLAPAHFWLLTIAADMVTIAALTIAGWLLTGAATAGLCAAALYAIYPLAVQQSTMYYPTAFQVAAIAVACALIAAGERTRAQRRLLLGFLAGMSLGIGYLFKEDVAIMVPVMALAATVARWPRLGSVAAVCAGAAVVFFAECAMYWLFTGQPLYRLTATSGLGAPLSEQLQIAEIWRWDAYLRSLWLMPSQVGLMWWVAFAALWFAWRTRRAMRPLAFVALVFVIAMLYLQFGSGSIGAYSPLPKTPRYTALATVGLMLISGAWLASLIHTRRRLGVLTASVLALAALPCIAYLHIASSERTRNTLAVAAALSAVEPAPLYTDYYSARVLRLLVPGRDIRVWYHAKFDENTMLLMNEPPPGAYVLLDRQSAKVYTSSYQLTLPDAVEEQPRRLLEGLRAAALRLPSGNPLRNRVIRNVTEIIDDDQATLYRVPAIAAQSSN